MCLADTVGSVQNGLAGTATQANATQQQATESMRLRLGTGQGTAAREQGPRGDSRDRRGRPRQHGHQWKNRVPNTVQSTADDTCPLFYGPTTGYGIWLDAANKPYVRLGGLWALKGTGSGSRYRSRKSGRDTMTVPASDEAISNNAAAHPVIAKLIEEQKAVKEALAGAQGVDAKVAECHRLLDTTTNEGTPSTTGKNVEAWLAWISTTAGPWTDAKVTPTSPRQASKPHTKCRGRQHAK
ncbi:hypothetical protein ERJ75_000636100 [Trypanosoma vivax]|nr:hypothetical protein ERJ75_000636100 [Trypanosoma vivax]